MNLSGQVTLILFTSEGREHLLNTSYPSFLAHNTFAFYETLLAIDGPYDLSAVPAVKPDRVLQQCRRKGYITSIQTALDTVKTPYFFWLEDDFIFHKEAPVAYMLSVLADPGWAGLFLSRSAPLVESDKRVQYADDLYLMNIGFSVSPSLCNTETVKAAFAALAASPKDESTRRMGFETFIDGYFVKNGYKYAVVDPGAEAHVTHAGHLESTPREYHMINSIDPELSDIDKFYLSGLGKEGEISLYNKLAMLPKLWYATLVLTFKLFRNRKAYDFAFRIYRGFLRGFKF